MATVYLARKRGLGGFEREVAIKLAHAHLCQEPDFERSVIEEAKLAARIRHPNVVSVEDVATSPHGVYMVMPYVNGPTLSMVLRRAQRAGKPIDRRIGLTLLCHALRGLHAAHELRGADGVLADLVHRDFSPQNVLIGEDCIARLTDFGIAKVRSQALATVSGVVKGKAPYMSPEQVRGDVLTRATDIWAAGVLAYEISVGRRLFQQQEEAQVLIKVMLGADTALHEARDELGAPMLAILRSALDLNPTKRHATAEHLHQALTNYLDTIGGLANEQEIRNLLEDVCGGELERRNAQIESARNEAAREPELAPLVETSDIRLAPASAFAASVETATVVPFWSRKKIALAAAFVAAALLIALSVQAFRPTAMATTAPSASSVVAAVVPSVNTEPATATTVAPQPAPSLSHSSTTPPATRQPKLAHGTTTTRPRPGVLKSDSLAPPPNNK
jgi:eukaryotic-like serine/threonine-protein kinase